MPTAAGGMGGGVHRETGALGEGVHREAGALGGGVPMRRGAQGGGVHGEAGCLDPRLAFVPPVQPWTRPFALYVCPDSTLG